MTLGIGQGCCCTNGCTSNVLTTHASQASVSVTGYGLSTVRTSGSFEYDYTLTALSGSLWNIVAGNFASGTVGNVSNCGTGQPANSGGCHAVTWDSNFYRGVTAANANWNIVTKLSGTTISNVDYDTWHNVSVSVLQLASDNLRVGVRAYEYTMSASNGSGDIRCRVYGCTDVAMVDGGVPPGFWTSTVSVTLYYGDVIDDTLFYPNPSSFMTAAGSASVTFS